MIPGPIEEIGEQEIHELVDNQVNEGKRLEFKRELSLDYDGHGIKFLAEITSFANSRGGDLVIGLDENDDTSEPEIYPLEVDNVDDEISRWEGVIRTGVSPRIPSYQIKPITVTDEDGNEGTVLVTRVRQSQIGPHRVTRSGHNEFYGRSSNGKYPLDVDELRQHFALSESLTEDIREFRIQRTARIRARDTPVEIEEGPVLVLHIIPFSAFSLGKELDINSIDRFAFPCTFQRGRPGSGDARRYNVDGLVNYWVSGQSNVVWGYTQTYRNGVIESVDGFFLQHGEGTELSIVALEESLRYTLDRHIDFLEEHEVDPPFAMFLSLMDAEGYYLSDQLTPAGERPSLDRDMVHLPEVTMDEYPADIDNIVDKLIGRLRNACGLQA